MKHGLSVAFELGALALASAAPVLEHKGGYMDCGSAPLCGVVTLETGLGGGAYKHDFVAVHGLWPETGKYGSSQCIKPSSSSSDPSRVYECFNHKAGSGGMSPQDFVRGAANRTQDTSMARC